MPMPKGKEPMREATGPATDAGAGAGAGAGPGEKKKSNISVLIASPAYGGQVHCAFMKSLMAVTDVLRMNGVETGLFMPESESLITRARNAACAIFLASDFTHLLFIDTDIVFPPQAVVALINGGYPISGVPYPIKGIDWENLHAKLEPGMTKEEAESKMLKRYCFDLKDPTGHQEAYVPDFDQNGFFQCDHLGTGFLMIRRDTLIAMSRTARKYRNDVDAYERYGPDVKNHFYDFFDTLIHPETKRYLSEDYAFCFKARRAGFDIWAYPHIELKHIGRLAYHGSFWDTYKFKNRETGEYLKVTRKPNADAAAPKSEEEVAKELEAEMVAEVSKGESPETDTAWETVSSKKKRKKKKKKKKNQH